MTLLRLLLLMVITIGGVGQKSLFATDAFPSTLRVEPQQRDDYNWAERHEAVLAYHRQVAPEVVFIGDSITHHWGGKPQGARRVAPEIWDALFANVTVSNLGFGYDYADNAYYRIVHGELDGIAPRLILLNIGTNNLGHRGDSPEACAANVAALVALIQRKQPQAHLLVLGIYPRREVALREPIRQTNALLKARLVGEKVTFAEIGLCLAGEDGLALPQYFRDTVHPNAAGYARLAAALKPYLSRLGGE